MPGYADPELLIATWLQDLLDVKVWANPNPPSNAWTTAPWVWIQRGQSPNGLALTLDDVLLDCDTYAADPDNARALAGRVRNAMMLQLPLTTLPGGVFCKRVETYSAPAWAPDPKYRRAAAYRVVLHGFIE